MGSLYRRGRKDDDGVLRSGLSDADLDPIEEVDEGPIEAIRPSRSGQAWHRKDPDSNVEKSSTISFQSIKITARGLLHDYPLAQEKCILLCAVSVSNP